MRRLVLEQPMSRAAIWSVRMAGFALAVTVIGLAVVRGGQQDTSGLAALGSGSVLAAIALLLAGFGAAMIWRHGLRGTGRVAAAIVLATGLLAPPAYMILQVIHLPELNDISTDIDEPPTFSRSRAALAARQGHVPAELPRERRKAQREAYQRLIPIITDLPPEEAYEVALKAARNMGWQIIETATPGGRSGTGRIEAIATTPVLRFRDDVTVRIRTRADGARLDMRSASRVGRHDLGANARRVQSFADEVQLLLNAR